MSNKARNIEAVRIHRPLVTGQARGMSIVELWCIAVTDIVFGVDLLPALHGDMMWHGKR